MSCSCGGDSGYPFGAGVDRLIAVPGIPGKDGVQGKDGVPGKDGDAADIAIEVHGADEMVSLTDDDEFAVLDSEDDFSLRRLSWLGLKTAVLDFVSEATATFRNKTLIQPKMTSIFEPINGLQVIQLTKDSRSTSNLRTSNASGGGVPANNFPPLLAVNGPDANIDLWLTGKGTGDVLVGNGTTRNVVVTTGQIQTLTNKTLTSPTLTGSITFNGEPLTAKVAVPAASNSLGSPGQWAADSTHLYVCVGSYQWRRVSLQTW